MLGESEGFPKALGSLLPGEMYGAATLFGTSLFALDTIRWRCAARARGGLRVTSKP